MADYLAGKKYARSGGKDYFDRLYESAEATREKPKNVFESKNYPYRCYCTQTFRYYHELKRHRKEANHQ